MDRVFLAFSFRPEDRELVSGIEHLLESHNLRTVTGESVGGEALTPAVEARIDASHALIALLTPRERKEDGRYTTHDWVRDELNYARAHHKPTIALLHTDVDLAGMYAEHERVDYDPNSPLSAFIKLSQTIGTWKRAAGRQDKIRVLPEEFGHQLTDGRRDRAGSYRLIRSGRPGPWERAVIIREVGGAFAYLSGVDDDSLIQLRIQFSGHTWISEAAAHTMHVTLKQTNGHANQN
jgi:hypothetical protein